MHAFDEIAQQANHVIADGSDREAFNGLLQACLQLGALVQCFEQFDILPRQLQINARADEIGCARRALRRPVAGRREARRSGARTRRGDNELLFPWGGILCVRSAVHTLPRG